MDRSAWVAGTSGSERVRSVALTLSQPRPAGWIAETARVSETVARKHLSNLVDAGEVEAVDTGGDVEYAPNPTYERGHEVQRLVENHDRDELDRLRQDLQDQAKRCEGRERRLVEYRLGLVTDAIACLNS